MNSARKLPRLNSDPSGYDKEAQYENFNKVGHAKFRSFRRSSSPDREAGDRGRDRVDNSMYNKYNNHRQDRDYNKYGNSRKDIRDSDRDRDRSPRDRKSWDYKEKSREKDGVDGRGNSSSCNDWTEHKSSSGKKYYYNSKTEVSQWEKPREWVEAEKSRQAQMDKSRDWCDQDKARGAPAKLHCDRNNRSSQDKHSLDGHRSSPLSSSSLAGQGGGGSGLLGRHRDRRSDRGGGSNTPSHSYQGHIPTSLHNHNSSTPNNHHDSHNHPNHLSFHRENSHRISESSIGEGGGGGGEDRGDATPTSEGEGEHHPAPGDQVMHPGGAVSLSAAISRITSQPMPGLSVSTQPGPGPGSIMSLRLPPGHPHSYPHPSPIPMYGHSSPPTPTHESLPSPLVLSPVSSRLPQSSLGQLGSLSQLHPPIQLTPSLSRLYKEPLISHVLGWPAEQVERGCNRIAEESQQISSHGITKVSADLKMARSLVRLAEIQATLQEQRILFLRQQMADLERVDRPNSREKSRDKDSFASRDPVLRDPLALRDSRDLLSSRDSVTRDTNNLASSSMSRDQSMPRDVPSLAREVSRDRENNLPRDQSHLAELRDRLPNAETLQSQNVGNNAYSAR
eukprot:GFUD01042789.1.p1 GENE.GFUD01042789.1~~GFUD01042789.1.p1  ORF type:complete len:618 (+),score=166.66 GFUD01042789.1:72-1925(+)